MDISKQEGFILSRGHKVWYSIVGDDKKYPDKLPLLILHGGPGAPHDYLESLEAIADTGRSIIFYDQLGCGNSDQPHDPSLWTVPLFVEELSHVCETLNLQKVHILGQSWGGMLAMEYALTKPENLKSLILADSPASMRQWIAETSRLRLELPPDILKTLKKHEIAGTTQSPEYEKAMLVFYHRHVCRLDPWPECLNRTFEKLMKNPEVYYTMNGPSEFHVTGVLKNWDITDRLGKIMVPTLVISGQYDEATPEIASTVQKGIPGAEWILFNNSSHMPHLEEPEKYIQVVNDFLTQVETSCTE
jgi:L-proline amide hydrolase